MLPSERLIQAVSQETNTDPLELPRLYDTLDPDALDMVVAGMNDGAVHFRYAECAVTITSAGSVQIDGDRPGTEIPENCRR